MTRAMLLCAGLGTRLGQLGAALPKPLLPVADIPIVRYGIALLVGHGIRDIVINVHHHADRFARVLGDGRALGARLTYSREEVLLGTGGGVKRALPLLDPDARDEPFVVMNGKLILDADVTALLAAHRAAGDVLATLLVRPAPVDSSFGRIDVDLARRRVRDMLAGGAHMFCGVHVTRPSVIARLPDGEACSIRQGYLPWLRAGAGEVAAAVHRGYFAEHSTPRRYLDGNLAILGGAHLRFPPGPVTGVDAGAVVDPSATIVAPVRIAPGARVGAGATVGPGVVVGRGATVAAGAKVARAVVWPGATASGIVEDAVVVSDLAATEARTAPPR